MRAIMIHQYLGTTLIFAGIIKALLVFDGGKRRWLYYLWIVLLLITSGLLVSYREPQGAYESGNIQIQNLEMPHK